MSDSETSTQGAVPRRDFLASSAGIAMSAGLIASYGSFAAMAGRYLYPAHARRKEWMYLTEFSRLRPGDSLLYTSPTGEKIAIARQGSAGDLSDLVALGSTCPHLGCQVHWEAQNNRFFCPCHNGAFDPKGKATAGPPAEAGQSLPQFPLKIEKGIVFIEVPTEKLG